jgi:peptidyl-prolyl cis-trans isomerase A (cyclophilin A)
MTIALAAMPAALFVQGPRADLSKARLKNPASFTERAPEIFKARFDTSKSAFVITVHRVWAPVGADRFYNLVKAGFYDECRFFRVIDNVLAQVGIHGQPAIQSAWLDATIPDEPVKETNKRGFVSFAATPEKNSRSTQFFINLVDNKQYDRLGFAPFGEVTAGMEAVDQFYSGYGEGTPRGRGPSQGQITAEGNAYLMKNFPKLDYVKKTTIEK